MTIIDALLGEHAVFCAQFAHLEQSIPVAETLAQVRAQAEVLNSALASHVRLEDELLFTALEPYIGPMGALARMRMEHDEIECALQCLTADQGLEEARGLLLLVIDVARGHFAKEEQVLFRVASQTLTGEMLAELGAQWAAHRSVTRTCACAIELFNAELKGYTST